MSAHGDSRKVVLAALAGNAAIACAKLVAAWLSGSVAMLAEGVHSIADTANQTLLLLGMRLAARRDPVRYPLGRAKEVYFWSFVVSLMLFLLGGVYAIYEGLHALLSGSPSQGSPAAAIAVLSVSLLFEGFSFSVALREFDKGRGDRPRIDALLRGRDPTIPVVLLEDAGAVLGLLIALVAISVSAVTGSAVADGIGSLVIGVLLCAVGLTLAYETHSLIIGEGATPEMLERTRALASETAGVERVTQLLSMHLGPQTIMLGMKVRFSSELTLAEVERATDTLEEAIRAALPEMTHIFVEPDSDYDPALDPAMRVRTDTQ